MGSITKTRQAIKGKLRKWPLDIVVAILICLICFCAFALGWVARSQVPHQTVQIKHLNLPTTQAASVYVGSENSDVYHYQWCSGAQRISLENKRYFENTTEAQKAGYRPAGNCPGLQ